MRQVTEIDSKWLREVAPHYYQDGENLKTTNKKVPRTLEKTSSQLKMNNCIIMLCAKFC